jgi:hypothetical protein
MALQLNTAGNVKPKTLENATAIYELIEHTSQPINATEICREFNLPKSQHPDISQALKLLRNHNKIEMIGNNRSARYMAVTGVKTDPVSKALLTPAEKAEQTAIAPVPKVPRARLTSSVLVEVPRATLKVLVKAVMANCSPMEGVLQRAVLQCMEKLI